MSQGSIVMPVVGPATAATMFGDVNGALVAIQSANSGSSAPANGPGAAPVTFQIWADTTANPAVFKVYDGASWVITGKLDTSAHTWTPSYKGTDLGTASTATTGTSGHTLGFLDGINTISAVWSGLTAAVDTNTTQLATTAFVLGQASASGDGTPAMDGSASRGTGTHFARNDHVHPTDTSRAPLASPTFTGTPAAPTAAVDTNTTQLATTAMVLAQAASATPLIDGTAAVGTSTRFARGDHVHPTDTSRAPLASPTFTGTPAAPTASPGTNTTQLASTAFVNAAVTAGITGVASIAGNTGAFTLSHGLKNSTNDIQIDIATQQGMLFGLTLSTAGSSGTFGIAPGSAVDSAATDFMKLTSAYTKTTSSWALGTAAGSLDTGTIANSTWYHAFLIKRPDTDVVDALTSLSSGLVADAASASFAVTIASPAVITLNNHGLQVGAPFVPSTTGALPTGMTAGTTYFVKSVTDANTIGSFALTQGGTAINTTGTQSGAHSMTSSPVLPTNYTLFRRVGSMLTDGSAHWTKFSQKGDEFLWDVPVQNLNFSAVLATAAINISVTTPAGIKTNALLFVVGQSVSGTQFAKFYSPDIGGAAASYANCDIVFDTSGGSGCQGYANVRTSTNSQIKAIGSQVSASSIVVNTNGWIDTRGKLN